MRQKIKITPDAPKNESGLSQMVTMRESIRHIWVSVKVIFTYSKSVELQVSVFSNSHYENLPM